MADMRVYLCGSFKNNWQERVIEVCPQHIYFNPRDFREITDPKIYTKLNLKGIELCDICFSYLEADNPTPINIALETAYAYALGKKIIFCCEWAEGQPEWFKERYILQLKEISDVVTSNLDDAINALFFWNQPNIKIEK